MGDELALAGDRDFWGVTTTAPINNVAGIGNSRKVQSCWQTYFTSDLALV